MATTTTAKKAVPGAPPKGVKCHICPKAAAGSVIFQSPTGAMKSLWLCRGCFKDTWLMLTTTEAS